LKPLNVIHRRRDSSQKKIGAVPTTSHTDPLSLTPSLISSVDEASRGAPMSRIAGMRRGTSPDRYIR
jgi:hypothetical protein